MILRGKISKDREKVRFTWIAPSSTVFFNLWTSSIKGISVSIATGLLRSEESTYIENYVENKEKQKHKKDGEKDFQLHAKENESSGSTMIKRSNFDSSHLNLKCLCWVVGIKIKKKNCHDRLMGFAATHDYENLTMSIDERRGCVLEFSSSLPFW